MFRLCHIGNGRWLYLLGIVAVNSLLFQSILVTVGNAPWSSSLQEYHKHRDDFISFPLLHSATKFSTALNPLTINGSDSINFSAFAGIKKNVHISIPSDGTHYPKWLNGMKNDRQSSTDALEVGTDRNGVHSFPEKKVDDKNESPEFNVVGIKNNLMPILGRKSEYDLSAKQILKTKSDIYTNYQLVEDKNMDSSEAEGVYIHFQSPMPDNVTHPNSNSSAGSSLKQNDSADSQNGVSTSILGRRKMKCEMPPKSRTLIQEMNQILVKHRAKSRVMKPRWPSKLDREIQAAKLEIMHASTVAHDKELYAPLFRNVSMFKRSYELMERTLKVYIYKDGDKPIFHQPILEGLYAAEGWFMKLMEENKNFVVKNPAKAHLFYLPFSSRMLEHSLYVRSSHNRTNLRQYLKDYTEKIAAKYPYFNRTSGADHFLVACHDWAPYETRHHMEYCIKALCIADVTQGFKIGRDVSLPETYVRSAKNPLRDLGGRPPDQRPILAFYAGSLHGYLRPILLKHWKDKDPNMKIFGRMPPGVASKMSYIRHMKNSKYCICPKGYEVLNWDAFSVILAEKDIPRLKDILDSIPEEKFLSLQLGVRRVQKHFLWRTKPLKYDLFHMTLHSIWYNRVFQINVRS
ncbi:probable glycosyltransferase At3g07620 isoform X2 [Prosopis cineraria]|uniref:probable glycosyltransferase At3g07620 isoform X2 n=1 Tax=Prosopis cineraria TaxID=364024 RepID=UPI0024109111|nr:probable glycosyltransferase At3g07620 isoform X2 [Prosopis cineraria]